MTYTDHRLRRYYRLTSAGAARLAEEADRLQRRYRRLLALYPRAFRDHHEHEMLGVLMDGAAGHGRRPGYARRSTSRPAQSCCASATSRSEASGNARTHA